MTGQAQGDPGVEVGLAFGCLDPDTTDRIDVHLRRAVAADDDERKDFHVRHARQLLRAIEE